MEGYNYKIFYVTLELTMKKKTIIDTQKIKRKETLHNVIK